MIYQGEIVYYIIKYQLLLLERIQGGGLRVLKTPPRLRRRVSDPLRATIIYLLLKIVSVLNVTDELERNNS